MANTAYREMKMEEDATYGKMQESLMEEARELSILCGVDVALLCAGGPGTGDGDGGGAVSTAEVAVWESEEGVLASYRAILPRLEAHTLRECLELKLARMGPSSPWCGSAAISACTCGMTRSATSVRWRRRGRCSSPWMRRGWPRPRGGRHCAGSTGRRQRRER